MGIIANIIKNPHCARIGAAAVFSLNLFIAAIVLNTFIRAVIHYELLLVPLVVLANALICKRSWPIGIGMLISEIALFSEFPKEMQQYNSISAELVLFGVLLHSFSLSLHEPHYSNRNSTALPWVLGSFLIVAAVSTYHGCYSVLQNYHYPYLSIASSLDGIYLMGGAGEFFPLRALLTLIEGFLLFLVIRKRISTHDLPTVIVTLLCCSIPLFIFCFWQAALTDPRAVYRGAFRIRGFFIEPNSLGAYVALLLPLLAYLLTILKDRIRTIALLYFSVLLLLLVLSASRGAWIGALCALMYIACSSALPLSSRSTLRKFTLSVIFLLCALLLFFYSTPRLTSTLHSISPDIARLTAPFDSSLNSNLRSTGRIALWGDALQAFLSQPITGIGLGQFFRTSPLREQVILDQENRYRNAHSYPLQVAAELGVVGFALVLIIVCLILSTATQQQSVVLRSRIFVKAAILAMLAHALVDHLLLYPEFLLLFLALVALLTCPVLSDPVDAIQPSRKELSLLLSAFLSVTLFLLYAEGYPLEHSAWSRDSMRLARKKERAQILWIRRGALESSYESDFNIAGQEELFGLIPRSTEPASWLLPKS